MPPRIQWTQEEEQYLRTLREQDGIKSWTEISDLIRQRFSNKNCSGKQCRERYVNHARFSCESSQQIWTVDDHEKLFRLVMEIGSKWRVIVKELNGKSQNSIKNKFYGAIRKIIRQMNNTGKKFIKKYTKPIKYDAIIRILQAAEVTWQLYPSIKDSSENLKNQILELAVKQAQEVPEEVWLEMINKIHEFNLVTRSYNLKKPRNFSEKLEKFTEKFPKQLVSPSNIAKSECPTTKEPSLDNPTQQKNINPSFESESSVSQIYIQQRQSCDNEINEKIDQMIHEDAMMEEQFYVSSQGSFDLDKQLCEIMGHKFIPAPDNLTLLF